MRDKTDSTKKTVSANENREIIHTFQEKLEDIKKYLKDNVILGMIIIDASKINKIEHEYGKIIYGDVLNSLGKIISGMKGKQIRSDDILTVNHAEGEQFYIFLSKKRTEKSFQSGDIESVAERVGEHVNKEMFLTVYPLLKRRPKISVGYAITIDNSLIQEERLINKLIEDAKLMANYLEFRALMRNKEKLQEIIKKLQLEIIDVNQNVSRKYALIYLALVKKGKKIPVNDVWIAASCMKVGGTLLTRDRNFQHVEQIETMLLDT